MEYTHRLKETELNRVKPDRMYLIRETPLLAEQTMAPLQPELYLKIVYF